MGDAVNPKLAGCARFEVSNWKRYAKDTVPAFLSFILSSRMTLYGCRCHRKNDSRWIGVPSQKFTKPDGSVGYTPVVEFTTDDAHRRCQEQAIAAVDRYLDEAVAK